MPLPPFYPKYTHCPHTLIHTSFTLPGQFFTTFLHRHLPHHTPLSLPSNPVHTHSRILPPTLHNNNTTKDKLKEIPPRVYLFVREVEELRVVGEGKGRLLVTLCLHILLLFTSFLLLLPLHILSIWTNGRL